MAQNRRPTTLPTCADLPGIDETPSPLLSYHAEGIRNEDLKVVMHGDTAIVTSAYTTQLRRFDRLNRSLRCGFDYAFLPGSNLPSNP